MKEKKRSAKKYIIGYGKNTRAFMQPFKDFIRGGTFGGILLLICTVAAMILANSPLSAMYYHWWETEVQLGFGAYTFNMPLHYWINDALMAIFFFVVGLEIKRELIVGELSSPRKAAFPAIAALGGMIVPALIFVLFNLGSDSLRGWAIPTATDIAFAIGIMSLLGKRIPFSLKIFITALAIVDDLGAVVVIALFYAGDINVINLGIAGGFFILLLVLNKSGIRHPMFYAIFGIGLWLALLNSGIHPTIGGVLTAMAIPVKTKIDKYEFHKATEQSLKQFEMGRDEPGTVLANSKLYSSLLEIEKACEKAEPPILRFEHSLQPWVNYFIMPLFAFANAGVTIGGNIGSAIIDPVFLGITAGLVLGKPIGIFMFTWISSKAGLTSKPSGTSWNQVFAMSMFGGIGFTMSLFIANLAYPDGTELPVAKTGILAASLLASLLAITTNLSIKKKPNPA